MTTPNSEKFCHRDHANHLSPPAEEVRRSFILLFCVLGVIKLFECRVDPVSDHLYSTYKLEKIKKRHIIKDQTPDHHFHEKKILRGVIHLIIHSSLKLVRTAILVRWYHELVLSVH